MDTLGIIRELEGDAALRAQLRAVLLGDAVLELPALVRQLTSAVETLAEAQARTEERLNALAEAQARTEERLNALAEAQARTEERLARFESAADQRFSRIEDDLGELKGYGLEARILANPRRYIPRKLATGSRLIDDDRLEVLLGAIDDQHAADLQLADALIVGKVGGADVVFVVEAAWRAHVDDVERASRRSVTLRSAGVDARGYVVSNVDPGDAALAAAANLGVAIFSESSGLLRPPEPNAA